jgi:hypothetical protein
MKKLLLVLLAFVYLGNSTGFAMHFHYCMDRLTSASILYGAEELQDCGMPDSSEMKKDDCCKDEVKITNVSSDQLKAEPSLKLMQVVAISMPLSVYEQSAFLSLPKDAGEYPVSNAPPNLQSTPVYLRNCTFII